MLVDEVSLLDDWDNVYVDVLPTAILRMGQFLSVLEIELGNRESKASTEEVLS